MKLSWEIDFLLEEFNSKQRLPDLAIRVLVTVDICQVYIFVYKYARGYSKEILQLQ